MLGVSAHEDGRLDRAEELLAASIDAIMLAGQSFVLVNALEALAAVRHEQGRHRQAAVLLGTAHAARESAAVHMRPIQLPDTSLRDALLDVLGTDAFAAAEAEGQHIAAADASRAASSAKHHDNVPPAAVQCPP